VTPFVVVLGALLALLVPLAFVAGLRLGVERSSSKLTAAESVMKAAQAVSRIAESASSRSSKDWNMAMRLESQSRSLGMLRARVADLLEKSDRMDVTLAKVAEWTVMAPGRKRIQPQSPVDLFVDRTRSALPSVPLFPEAEESGLATLAGPTERGPG
jgi:hypothetical protein